MEPTKNLISKAKEKLFSKPLDEEYEAFDFYSNTCPPDCGKMTIADHEVSKAMERGYKNALIEQPSNIELIDHVCFGKRHSSNVLSIGQMFRNNDKISQFIELGAFNHLAAIEDSAFKNCISLKRIVLPKNTTIIGESAFENCTSLEGVDLIGSPIQVIGPRAFRACRNLKSSPLPQTRRFTILDSDTILTHNGKISVIGEQAFEGCISIEEAYCTYTDIIESRAFALCTSLKRVVIYSSKIDVASDAFEGCTSLERIDVLPAYYDTIKDSFPENLRKFISAY